MCVCGGGGEVDNLVVLQKILRTNTQILACPQNLEEFGKLIGPSAKVLIKSKLEALYLFIPPLKAKVRS